MTRHSLAIVAGMIALASAASFVSSPAPAESANLPVYTSAEQCAAGQGADVLFACQQLEIRAQAHASATNWGFKSQDDCDSVYGSENCEPTEEGVWGVKLAGFTQFSSGETVHSVLPVYRSSVHPGLYLPNGYPVLAGNNTVPAQILSNGAFAAGKPRSLGQTLCIKDGGEKRCDLLHAFLTSGGIERPVLNALFN